jgi:hypothetical protein
MEGFPPGQGVYFTSCAGDHDQIHTARTYIRGYDFDPEVIKEPSMLAKQRRTMLE